MDIYPRRRTVWTTILVYGSFAIGVVIWPLVAADSITMRGWAGVVLGLVVFPLGLWRAIGQLRHPLPFARLDDEGLDCGLGRVPWRNISNVSVAWHWIWAGRGSHPSRRLYLDLRDPAEAPTADTRRYLSGMPFGVPVEADGKIRVPLWGSKEQVLADVGRYYSAV